VPVGSVSAYSNANGWKAFEHISSPQDTTDECTWMITGSYPSYTLTIAKSSEGSGVMEDYASPDSAPWHPYRASIASLAIDSMVSIGSNAFSGCSALTSVSIPAGVTTIGSDAFAGCSGLTSVTIPAGVTTIGSSTFSGCSGLTSVSIPASVTTIGSSAFSGCSGLTSVTIPAGVTTIGSDAFAGCSGLTSVTIPAGVTGIGYSAFYGCSGLTSVTIPASVTGIGSYAFSGCSGLTSVINYRTTPQSISSNVFQSIDQSSCKLYVPMSAISAYSNANVWSSFDNIAGFISGTTGGCTWMLTSLTGESSDSYTLTISKRDGGNGSMANYTGGSTAPWYSYRANITSLVIDNGVVNIGDNAFYGYSALTSVSIPASVTKIGSSTFAGCSALTSVSIPASVTFISTNAFDGCSGLTSVNIPASVIDIGNYAFRNCSALTSVNIPVGVATIGPSAFDGCSGLTSVSIPAGVTTIHSSTFAGCSGLTSVTIPASVTTIGSFAFSGCSGLTSVINYRTTPQSINNSNVFAGVDKSSCKLYVPMSAVSAYSSTYDWNYFDNIFGFISGTTGGCTWMLSSLAGESSDSYTLAISKSDGGNGSMASYTSASTAPWYSYREGITSLVIDNGVVSIGNNAFSQGQRT
jgi:hypothetical protein